jgi:hypothetical protein
VQTAPKGRTTLQWTSEAVPGIKPGDLLPARWYEETLEPLSGSGNVAARFPDGSAAAVFSTYGKGKTLMLGSYVSAAYVTSPSAEVERFYTGLLTWAGVVTPVTAQGGSVEARTLEAGKDRLLFIFNHEKHPIDAIVGLRLPTGKYRASDLITAQPVSFGRDRASVRFEKRMQGSDVWVLRLSPE